MIEIFRYQNKWRVKIVNETLEFKTTKEFEEVLSKLIKIKEKQEPHAN